MPEYATPDQSSMWLHARMDELDIPSLDHLAALSGIDKGNLSRIFRQVQRPRVTALEPLAAALRVSIHELLVRIGAVDPHRHDSPAMESDTTRSVFQWPSTV